MFNFRQFSSHVYIYVKSRKERLPNIFILAVSRTETIHLQTLFFPQTVRIPDGLPHGSLCSCDVCKQSPILQDDIKVYHNSVSGEHEQSKILSNEFITEEFPLKRLQYTAIYNNHLEVHKTERSDSVGVPNQSVGTSYVETHQHLLGADSGKSFNYDSRLETHEAVNTEELPYLCSVCKEAFSEASNLYAHQRKHITERPYSCDVCKKSFQRPSYLKRHQRVHTGEQPPLSCVICKKIFTRRSHLRTHQRIHTGERPYSCDVCKRSFSDSSCLSVHQRRHHTGERPYSCDFCKKAFFTRSQLRGHLPVHTGKYPYSCDDCKRSFCSSSNSYLHQRRYHTGERPHSCEICNESFLTNSQFRVHIGIHTGEHPFSCSVCKRCFSDASNLRRHQRRSHSGGLS